MGISKAGLTEAVIGISALMVRGPAALVELFSGSSLNLQPAAVVISPDNQWRRHEHV